ncbi:DUF3413 domain-containing protein [Pasteurella bettyae]|uniref:DUF3413 domain-containing protein n=1 Tax=Pasteurella bettyae TaxID=752 RepID=UPI003D2AF73E
MKLIKNGKQYREAISQKISWGHWFTLFNIIWAILIGSRYAFIIDWPATLLGKIYFFISILGHFSFVVFTGYLLIIFPLSFLIKNNRTFRGVSVILASISLTLLVIDTEVFSRFSLHLSSLVWNLLVNPEDGELSRDWQIFFAPMPILLLVQMIYSRWSWNKLRSLERQKWIRKVGFTLVAMFIATHLIYAWADAMIYRPITMQKSNFPLSHPMTARTFLEKNGLLDKSEYEETVEQQGRPEAANIDYPKHKLNYQVMTEKPNILIINISGLRYDSIIESKMPTLTQFAKQSTQFMNHYSSGNNNNLGLVGLFYGLNSRYADSILQNKAEPELIKKIQAEHYQLGIFSATNFKDSLFKQAIFQKMNLPKIQPGNQSAVKNWINWLDVAHQEQPWFSYLDLDLLTPIESQTELSEQAEMELYDNQLKDADTQLNAVIEQLTNRNLLDNTLVLITSSHGHAFHLSKESRKDYFGLDEIQVPLIIHWQALPAGQQSKLTSHTDIVSTLMPELFKVNNPISDYAQGENLAQEARKADWVLVGNYRWNVIIVSNGNQYHIDRKGRYQKYNVDYEKVSSTRPPLGLFLEIFTQSRSFVAE